MDGSILPKDIFLKLSTRDKFSFVDKINQCQQLGLIYISSRFGKTVYYDPSQKMYWSVWDPHVKVVIDKNFRDPIILLPAHEQADYVAKAQAMHFQLNGRKDLARRIQIKHGFDIAITAIPEIKGSSVERLLDDWEKQGKPKRTKPVKPLMFAKFVEVMMDEEAPLNADANSSNIIVGNDKKLYCIDFSLENANDPKYRDLMMVDLVEIALECELDWNELPLPLQEASKNSERGYSEQGYNNFLLANK